MISPVLLNHNSIGSQPDSSSSDAPHDIVILHGLFGDLNNWRAQAERLSGRYRVHSMDLRNHGDSPHAQGMSYAHMAADVEFTCKHLGIEKTYVIGHSMGGKTAMKLALNVPDLVARLIVVDIGPRKYPRHHDDILSGLKMLDKTSITQRRDADQILQSYVPDAGIRAFLLKNLTRKPNGQYKLRINLAEIDACYDDIAGALTSARLYDAPVLFIKGGDSDYLKETDRPAIASLFTHPSLKEIDGTGHWPHVEKPDTVYKIISDFLADGASASNA